MQIFFASTHTINNYMPSSRLWYVNLYLPLIDLGHEVVHFKYDLLPHYQHADVNQPDHQVFIQANRPRLEEALLYQIAALHREKPIDLFFSYFYGAFCRPEIIAEIRRMGIVTVNWYCNASYQFHLVEDIAPAYDYCLVPEKFRMVDYRRIGANPIYFQEAANPNFYKPYPLKQEFDVVFVGQKYGERSDYIRHLWKQGIDIRVWGQGWLDAAQEHDSSRFLTKLLKYAGKTTRLDGWKVAAHTIVRKLRQPASASRIIERTGGDLPTSMLGPPLSDDEMVKMYSRSKISLGFSTCGETHRDAQRIMQVRLRDFEAPMSGAFYIVEYMEELEEFFKIGKEIVCYHDKADLADKIKYYLTHDEERERVRQAGHARALADHSWQRRFQVLFESLQLV
jgi:spore maturation protein CgeB